MEFNPKFEKRKYNQTGNPRKKRSDAKNNIKIYVAEDVYNYLVQRALLQRTSIGQYATDQLIKLLERRHFDNPNMFPMYQYNVTPFMIHLDVDDKVYEQIVTYAMYWNEKHIRRVAHRLFHYGLEKRLI